MTLDWLRFWPELIRLNLVKARHRRRVRAQPGGKYLRPSPCQSSSDSGRPRETRCEACHRFDRSLRYRHVCPDIIFVAGEARCARDSAEVRPYWGRAFAQLALPLLAAYFVVGLALWGALRSRGLEKLSLTEVLVPSRWAEIAEHRRARFQKLALHAIASRDDATASIALFSAAQTGEGTPETNLALARLATLGGYHSLADELYASTLEAHPASAARLTVAWHDDLLLSDRPHELARLALARLALPDADREFWLKAFFESIRHPRVAADLLATQPAPTYPHPGLAFALEARAALDRQAPAAASDRLLAFSGLLPGQAARRFLAFSWLEAGDPARARAAALSSTHPAPPGEIAALSHALLLADGHRDEARAALRPLFREPSLRPLVLAALVRDPDAETLREFAGALPAAARSEPPLLVGLWLAARRAGAADLATDAAEDLARAGHPIPPELLSSGSAPASREKLALAASFLPLDREVLYALREAR